MDYQTYLRSRKWQKKRLAVLRRGKGVCERCGEWPIVNVHHLTYVRLGDELLADLLGVCIRCHEAIHQDRQQ